MNTRFWKSKGQLEGMACRNYNQRVGEKDKIFGTARTVNITPRNSTSGNNLVFAKE
jgi:regulator of RNase E activity RraA